MTFKGPFQPKAFCDSGTHQCSGNGRACINVKAFSFSRSGPPVGKKLGGAQPTHLTQTDRQGYSMPYDAMLSNKSLGLGVGFFGRGQGHCYWPACGRL